MDIKNSIFNNDLNMQQFISRTEWLSISASHIMDMLVDVFGC